MRALAAVLIDDAYEKNIHVLILGEIACSPRTSRKGKENQTLYHHGHPVVFADYIAKNPSFSGKIPKVVSVRIDIRGPSTPGVPSPRQGREDRLILNGLSASELSQGQRETKAGVEHSIEILAGIDQRRVTETSYPRFRIRPKPRLIAEDSSDNEAFVAYSLY